MQNPRIRSSDRFNVRGSKDKSNLQQTYLFQCGGVVMNPGTTATYPSTSSRQLWCAAIGVGEAMT